MKSPEVTSVIKNPPMPESVEEFFETHKDFLESYVADSSIEIKPSPPGLGTFAIDLQKGTMFAEPKFFTERGYSLDKAMFATLHELEHFLELRELLADKNGAKVWKVHLAKIKASRHFKIFDNCFDDIKMNRAVVSRVRFFLEDEAKWNYGRCFALKCDIRKYFDSVNQQILLGIVHSRVTDEKFFGVTDKSRRAKFPSENSRGVFIFLAELFCRVRCWCEKEPSRERFD